MLTKKINLPLKIDFLFVILKDSKLLLLNIPSYKKMYVAIPKGIKISKKGTLLILSCKKSFNTELFERFHVFLSNWLKNLEKPFKKQLVLKGLGFKAEISKDSSCLELKLGFSSLVKVSIPKDEILVTVNKNILTFEGFDPVAVGNFANKVRSLKFPDVYKGKGFWYKNEVRSLKEIKKT
jgi:large subunit ribosomal protein L6